MTPRVALTTIIPAGALAVALALTGCAAGPAAPAASSPTTKTSASASTPSLTPTPAGTDQVLVSPGTEVTPVPTDAPLPSDTSASETAAPSVEKITASDEPSLVNTTWSGSLYSSSGITHQDQMAFTSEGDITWTEDGHEVEDSTWERTGDDVTITTSGGFATFEGTISDDKIKLSGSNQNGYTFTLTLTKQ